MQQRRYARSLGCIVLTSAFLVSCGGGSGSGSGNGGGPPPPLAITTSSLPGGQAGAAYSTALAASGGTTPYNWSVSGGALPGGLSLNTSSGQISGTPAASGMSSFTAKVADASAHSATLSLQITVTAKPAGSLTITTGGVAGGQVGAPYGSALAASGGTAPYGWSVSAGALPAGLSLNASSGQITGTPSTAGAYSFTAKVTDASSPTASATLALSLTVATPPTSSSNLSSAPGWHKIPSTAVCGGGSEHNAAYTDPDNFPQNLNAAYASYGLGFSTQCYSLVEDSNSGAYDTTRHRLILFGGGHEHYWGNDLISLELTQVNTAAATPMYHLDHSANPNSCPSSGSGTVSESNGAICKYDATGALTTVLGLAGCSYLAGCTPSQTTTPGSVHTYNGSVYIPGSDTFAVFGGITAPKGNASQNVWLLSMSSVLYSCAPNATTNQQGCNPAWSSIGNLALNNTFVNPYGAGTMAVYDPYTQGVWTQNQSGLEWFNPANDSLTVETHSGIGYHSTGVLDPNDKYLIMIGPQSTSPLEGILYVDVACSGPPACTGSNFTLHQPATTGCANLTGGTNTNPQYMGAVWDPVGKRVVIYPNTGNVIWYLDPTTWTCTSVTYGATQGTDYPQNTPLPSGDAGTFGHFAYDPTFDVFVLCNDPYNDCWYLRPSR